MDSDGKLPAVDKIKYPRPQGGPEPSPLGDSRPFGMNSTPVNPGYDYSGSMPGVSKSDLSNGFSGREKITDAGSDGDQGA